MRASNDDDWRMDLTTHRNTLCDHLVTFRGQISNYRLYEGITEMKGFDW